jgi:hypothetical protein
MKRNCVEVSGAHEYSVKRSKFISRKICKKLKHLIILDQIWSYC